ncbi:T9SS type A sorting domain-containing protein [candidate division WOR-3 bacterium]|nr:T9SS type A sorting domain-containing protein [candidate division WOR-3 bacterium]
MVKKRMNYLLITLILLLIGCSFIASLWAEEPPLFQFKPGSNTLILQIVNSTRFELLSLKVSIDKPDDINWLRLEDEAQVSRVPAQNQGQPLEVGLNFVVKEDCTEKFEESCGLTNLTLKFRDAVGHSWSFPIMIQVADNLPTRYALYQNYPNPSNCRTTIKYDVPVNTRMVTLKMFNLLGQEVRTLVNGKKAAGRYSVTCDGKDNSGGLVASGTYFYVLESGDFIQVKKLTLTK